MFNLRYIACFFFLTGCTAAPGHRLVTAGADFVYLPAPCIKICELQQTGRLRGKCSERDYRRYRSFGMSCKMSFPNRSRLKLNPLVFGQAR